MKFDFLNVLGVPRLPEYLVAVQAGLERATHTPNPHIQRPVSRIVTAPSKRLRSALVIASAGGRSSDQLIAACVAIELVHLGSLVHDDIMDNATTRWGVQTIHNKEGLNQAILVGDYLFAKANQVAASVSPALAELVATAIINLCDGQAQELASLYDTTRTLDSYTAAITGKTASLLSAACKAGAVASGQGATQAKALGTFGGAFGLSFQLVDDVLDLVSTPALLGKPTASDVREGVYTMPVLLGLRGSQAEQLKIYLKKAKDEPLSSKAYPILYEPINQTLRDVKKYNYQAERAIEGLNAGLATLPTMYTGWALANLVADEHKDVIHSREAA